VKIGLFGGSFNPPHLGHLQSALTVLQKTGLDQVTFIPTSQNPFKTPVEGPTSQQRLEMVQAAVTGYHQKFTVDDLEIRRGGRSYAIDTIKEYRKTHEAEDLFFIMGVDSFEELDQWKDFAHLIEETNFIVTSRPGLDLPTSIEELPQGLQKFVADFDFNFVDLKTGRNIQFITLKDVDTSSTELRKQVRIGRNVSKFLPLAVETYVKEHKLYAPLGHKIADYQQFTQFCAGVLFDRKAIQVKGFDLRSMSAPSEFTLVASGTSTRHATSLGENVMMRVKEEYGVLPQSVEGTEEGRWVLIDYGSLIIHLFYDYVRNEYALENLWKQAVDLNLKDPTLEKKA
jgi:nicotinate-nucleotide adenylyltransferase